MPQPDVGTSSPNLMPEPHAGTARWNRPPEPVPPGGAFGLPQSLLIMQKRWVCLRDTHRNCMINSKWWGCDGDAAARGWGGGARAGVATDGVSRPAGNNGRMPDESAPARPADPGVTG